MNDSKKRDYSKEGKTVLEKPAKPVRLSRSHTGSNGNHYSNYRCNCGNIFVARDKQINSGKTSSCGCFAKKVRAHNIQSANIKKHLREVEGLNEVKKRKFLKEKYSKQYTKILLELSITK